MKVPNFLKKLGIERILILDWETYFDTQYTLTKLSTSEYIRDKRFKAHGIGLRLNHHKRSKWITHSHLKMALEEIDWSTTAILAHHTHFDGLILTHHYKYKPAFYLDTLSMARVWIDHSVGNSLNEVAQYYELGNKMEDVLGKTKGIRELPKTLEKKLGAYCCQDIHLTWEIFQAMWEEGFPEEELRLIDLTVRMFVEPVLKVNKPLAKQELDRIILHNQKVIRNTASFFHLPRSLPREERMEEARKILASDTKLATAMEKLGAIVPMKTTPKGNVKPAFAKTDLEFHELQMHPDKKIRQLCEARLIVKSTVEESKAAKLLLHADPALPIYLNYGRAHTFRWTGGDKMNPQNFPREGDLRKCIIAPRGHKLIVVDSGQIEARVVAWLAEQWNLLAAFADPTRDVYCEYAADTFNKKVTKKNVNERFVGKVQVLGLGFQMGPPKYQYTLASGSMGKKVHIELSRAIKAVEIYRKRNDKIVDFWKFMQNCLKSMTKKDCEIPLKDGLITFKYEAVSLPNGLELHYPDLHTECNPVTNYVTGLKYWNGNKHTKIYGGLFTENLTQAIARLIIANQMLEIAERYRIVMMSHDEIIYLAPTSQAQKALDFGIEVLSTSKNWYSDLPLIAEGIYGSEYLK